MEVANATNSNKSDLPAAQQSSPPRVFSKDELVTAIDDNDEDAKPSAVPRVSMCPASAEQDDNNKKKRKAEQDMPTLSKEQARQKLALPPPKEPKKKTPYMRFKIILTKTMKARKETLSAADAKAAWGLVEHKNVITKHVLDQQKALHGEDAKLCEYLDCKFQSQAEESNEKAKYKASLNDWQQEFQQGAEAFLQYATMEATVENLSELERAIQTVSNVLASSQWSSPSNTIAGLQEAKNELVALKKEKMIQDVIDKLHGANKEELRKHAVEYLGLVGKAAQLNKIKQAEQEQNKKDLEAARGFKSQMIQYLKSQMKFSQDLKNRNIGLTWQRGGVTPEMFHEAFGTPPDGEYQLVLDGIEELGTKSLRYGARLACKQIKISLSPDGTLFADTYLEMQKQRTLGGMPCGWY